MSCKKTIHELVDYFDGALEPDLLRTIEEHLAACDDCRVVVNTCRKTIELYCNSEPLSLPPDVRTRLDRALAERLGREPR